MSHHRLIPRQLFAVSTRPTTTLHAQTINASVALGWGPFRPTGDIRCLSLSGCPAPIPANFGTPIPIPTNIHAAVNHHRNILVATTTTTTTYRQFHSTPARTDNKPHHGVPIHAPKHHQPPGKHHQHHRHEHQHRHADQHLHPVPHLPIPRHNHRIPPMYPSRDAPSPGPRGREFSSEDYFNTQRPPAALEQKTDIMRQFVDKWARVDGKKVVLVTVSRRGSGEMTRAGTRRERGERLHGTEHIPVERTAEAGVGSVNVVTQAWAGGLRLTDDR